MHCKSFFFCVCFHSIISFLFSGDDGVCHVCPELGGEGHRNFVVPECMGGVDPCGDVGLKETLTIVWLLV